MAYLRVGNNTAFSFATGDFTVECWVNIAAYPQSGGYGAALFDNRPASTEGLYPTLYLTSNGSIVYYTDSNVRITSASIIPTATWTHIALVKRLSQTILYINGAQSGSAYSDTNNYLSSDVYIGASFFGTAELYDLFSGNITNYRIVKGVGVYTNTFTPSTSPLTVTQSAGTNINAITGNQTSLLTCQSVALYDASTYNFTVISSATSTSGGTPFTPPTVARSYVQVSTGNNFALTLDNLYKLYSTGDNTAGQLNVLAGPDGRNEVQPLSSPVQVGVTYYAVSPVQVGNNSWNKISSGQKHVIALRSDNTLYAWGLNGLGQLGTDTGINRSSPVQIGANTYKSISAGISHNLAIDATDKLVGFGVAIDTDATPNFLIPVVTSWTGLAAGINRSFGVRSDGTLWAWGNNTSGLLGLGDSVHRSVPTRIGTSSWSTVSAGYTYVAAIRSDGRLFTWGTNIAGELGYGDLTSTSSPTQVGTSSWSSVTAGPSNPAAIRSDGSLFMWGINTSGQLGNLSLLSRSSPVQIGTSSWTMASSGVGHTIAIRSDGGLFTWGNNTAGQLGDNTTAIRSSPVQVGTSSWSQVAAATLYSLGITSARALFGWGNGVGGTTGLNIIVHRSSPTQIGTSSWSFVAAGFSTSVAVRSDGGLFTWGQNLNGQLGDGTSANKSSPTQIGTSSYTFAAAGVSHNLFRLFGGLLIQGAGSNTNGPLGDGTLTQRNTPVFSYFNTGPSQIGTSSWSQVAAGYTHSLAIRSDGGLFGWGDYAAAQFTNLFSWIFVSSGFAASLGIRSNNTLWGWGLNNAGQMGVGDTTNRSTPVQIGISSWASVGGGFASTTAAIRADGSLFVWGLGTTGQIGNLSATSRSSPVQVGTSSWISVTTQETPTIMYAIRQDGALFGWGQSSSLVDPVAVNRSSPTQIGTSSWIQISAGRGYVAGIDPSRNLWIWGGGTAGQLGVGSIIGSVGVTNPALITTIVTESEQASYAESTGATIYSWSQISAGASHVLAVRSDRSLFAWGSNANGQIGSNNTISVGYPRQIGVSSWSQVSAGGTHSAALRSDGAVFVWGVNTNGQLGLSDVINRSSPTQLGTISATRISAGGTATGYISNSGLFLVGLNTNGQLGINNTVTRSSPVQVGTSSWTNLTGGGNAFIATRLDNKLFIWGSQVGDGVNVSRSSPVQISTLTTEEIQTQYAAAVSVTPFSWTGIATGASHTIAVRSDGGLFAWGINTNGQLGDLTILNKNYPVQLGTSSWSSVGASLSYSYAINSVGSLFAWGANTDFVLGTTDSIHRSSPTQIGTSSWTQVALGGTATFAIRSDGGLFSWGAATQGQLGTNDAINRSSPVQVGTSSWSQVSAGQFSGTVAGILRTGQLFTWGSGTLGALGINATGTRSSPTQIGTGLWTRVSVGNNFVIALDSTSVLYSWGKNLNGQLGDDSIIHRSSPTQVTSILTESDQYLYLDTGNFTSISWAQISGGLSHTVALRTDGSLWGWGFNTNGQLGDLETTNKYFPVKIGSSSWTFVCAGFSHSAAIRSDGALFTWGLNTSSQLGLNDAIHRSSPTQVGTSSWSSVSAGGSHTVATNLSDNVFVWGGNASGQLGLNDVTTRTSPVQLSSTFTGYQISAGKDHTALIDNSRLLYTWGLNAAGQLGEGSVIARSAPAQITTLSSDFDIFNYAAQNSLTLQSWRSVSTGTSFALAIDSNYHLYAWGLNTSGQVGNSSITNTSKPILINSGSWIQINAGGSHSSALRSDGIAFVWGNNTNGQLGFNDRVHRSSPTQIGTGSWVSVSAGLSTTLAIDSAYRLWAWGSNANGSLGVNDIIFRSSPVQVGTSSWSQVTSDQNDSIAIRSDGTLWTWGFGTNGEIGQGLAVHRSSPVQITSLGGVESNIDVYVSNTGYIDTVYYSWTSIASNVSHTVAIRNDGMLFAWGANDYGQLGTNDRVNTSEPVMIGTSSWVAVTAATHSSLAVVYTLALRSDGALFGWGSNTGGMLGFLDQVHRSSPTQIGTSSWLQVSAGEGNSLALRLDGGLFSWGVNTVGRLGTGDAISRSSPTQLGTSSWSQISAGGSVSAAIRTDGSLFTWGFGGSGLLGDNTTVTKSSPVQIGTDSWTFISAGQNSAAGIKTDSSLYIWGFGGSGRLGLNTQAHRSSPTQLGTSSWSMVALGDQNGYGILVDGSLFAWGLNAGVLGNNDTIARSSPVQIGTSAWATVNTGKNAGALVSTAAAIRADGRLFMWGVGSSGQLGTRWLNTQSSPVVVASITDSWTTGSAGLSHTVAIRNDGMLFTWGGNTAGQLGLSNVINRSVPGQVGNESWTSLYGGATHTIALRNNGTLWTWGSNTTGELGVGDLIARSSPVQVGTESWTVVGADQGFSGAIANDGSLYTWGLNNVGQLGNLRTGTTTSPVFISGIYDTFNAVAAGGSHTVAIRNDGILTTWGLNTAGQLGDSTVISKSTPVQLAAGIPDGYYSLQGITSGAGSRATWPIEILTSDFTVEFWTIVRVPITISYGNGAFVDLGNLEIAVMTSGDIRVASGTTSGTTLIQVAYSWQANTWVHIALVRISGVMTLYINGTTYGSVANSMNITNPNSFFYVLDGTLYGGSRDNYISNLRVTKGVGVYTGDFTVPTTALTLTQPADVNINAIAPGQCVMLVAQSATLVDNSGNATAWTSTDRTRVTSLAPFPVPSGVIVSWTQVSAGDVSSFGIQTTKLLYGWGNNASGTLGDGTVVHRSSPTQIGTDEVASISAGGLHSLSIRENSALYAWGGNGSGQIGNTKATAIVSSPTFIKTINDSWNTIGTGDELSLAIRSDYILYTSGLNTAGQLGLNDLIARSNPTQVGSSVDGYYSVTFDGASYLRCDAALSTFTSAAVSFTIEFWVNYSDLNSRAAFTINNSTGSSNWLGAWMYPTGYIGISWMNITVYNSPAGTFQANTWYHFAYVYDNTLQNLKIYVNGNILTTVSAPITVTLSTGTFAIGTDFDGGQTASDFLIGRISNFRIVNNANVYTENFIPPTSPLTAITGTQLLTANVSTIRDISSFARIISTVGSPRVSNIYPSTFTTPPLSVNSWSQVTAGTIHAAALTANSKSLYVWGANGAGQIGNSRAVAGYSSPVFVPSITESYNTATTSVTGLHSAVVRADGALFTWGNNGLGQLGLNDIVNRSAPVQIGNSSWTSVAAGGSTTLAIRSDNRLFSWGENQFSQLGLNDAISRSSPTQIGTSSWTMIAITNSAGYAMKTNGNLFAWGNPTTAGDLGVTRMIGTSSPVLVKTVNDSWVSVVTGFSHTVAMRHDRKLFVWGFNTNGELGTNDMVHRSAPVQLGEKSWNMVNASSTGTIARDLTELIYVWGNNSVGQLGLNNLISVSSPTLLTNAKFNNMLSAGVNSVLAIRDDGILFAWGQGAQGQIGDGALAARSSPTQVGATSSYYDLSAGLSSPVQIGTSSWSQVAASNNYNLVVRSDNVLFAWGNNGVTRVLPTLTNQGYSAASVEAGTSNYGFIQK